MEQKEEDESHKIISTIKALTHRKWMKKINRSQAMSKTT
jgi:hypothetical protein